MRRHSRPALSDLSAVLILLVLLAIGLTLALHPPIGRGTATAPAQVVSSRAR